VLVTVGRKLIAEPFIVLVPVELPAVMLILRLKRADEPFAKNVPLTSKVVGVDLLIPTLVFVASTF
jgi:hypothetical protein